MLSHLVAGKFVPFDESKYNTLKHVCQDKLSKNFLGTNRDNFGSFGNSEKMLKNRGFSLGLGVIFIGNSTYDFWLFFIRIAIIIRTQS